LRHYFANVEIFDEILGLVVYLLTYIDEMGLIGDPGSDFGTSWDNHVYVWEHMIWNTSEKSQKCKQNFKKLWKSSEAKYFLIKTTKKANKIFSPGIQLAVKLQHTKKYSR